MQFSVFGNLLWLEGFKNLLDFGGVVYFCLPGSGICLLWIFSSLLVLCLCRFWYFQSETVSWVGIRRNFVEFVIFRGLF